MLVGPGSCLDVHAPLAPPLLADLPLSVLGSVRLADISTLQLKVRALRFEVYDSRLVGQLDSLRDAGLSCSTPLAARRPECRPRNARKFSFDFEL